MLSGSDLNALWLTLKLAGLSTVILLVVGIPLAWWLSRTRMKIKVWVESLIALPLVLPPTVLGFYLLVALGPHGPLGGLMEYFGFKSLAFSFPGLVMGSIVYSFPFVVQPLQTAFLGIDKSMLEVASTLRATPVDRFFSVVIPAARPGILAAATLGFAHTLGEFGVVLMIGGNIPGETRVLSIAIYDHVEALEYSQAHTLAGFMLVVSFVLLFLIYRKNLQHQLFGRRNG